MIAHLKERLKVCAKNLGFATVGVAPAVPLEHARQVIEERVAAGLLKDYGFARRGASEFTTPERVLRGARSMIVVALPYRTDDPVVEDDLPRGRIARFARGRDYHLEVEERLGKLGEWLRGEVPGSSYRICVDTGPMIDRAAAWLAGIGSYGKNASIITKEAGSWVVLGELITDIEIEPDEPAPMEECGECSICMSACPAGAIIKPFVIDQTRCISHLTQMKGEVPVESRRLMGDRIYGCDVCQEVCPKNSAHVGKLYAEVGLGARPELTRLLDISEEEFRSVVGPTAVGWIGRKRLLRNAAIALENRGGG